MTFKTEKIDEANAKISGTISAETLDKNLDKIAAQAAKTMDIQGFRKGKVPVKVVKQRYADKLKQDAQGEAIREMMNDGLAELSLAQTDLIGEPNFTKFDEKEDGSIEVEISLSCKPNIDLGDYKSLVPAMDVPTVDEKELEDELTRIAEQGAPLEKLKRKRMARSGDHAVIDFEGFKDGEPFEGGKAENYTLELGSNSFIPGFEDQVIGMKYEEEKEISVTFPEEYQAADLAGADVVFKVKLHELQEKVTPELNDELAKKVLPNDENATLETLKEQVNEQLLNQKKMKYFMEEIKPAYTQSLVDGLEFAVPSILVDQEINQQLNGKVGQMSEDEIKALQEDPESVKKNARRIKT